MKGIVHDYSSTGQTSFIEPSEIIELNNYLSELQFKIIEEKNQILRKLTNTFYPLKNGIIKTHKILLNLDKYFTKINLYLDNLFYLDE